MGSGQRWFITGPCGQLGAHISRLLTEQGIDTLGVGHRPCGGAHGQVVVADVSVPEELRRILDAYRPTHILHLAAISSPTVAERRRDDAWRLHVDTTTQLAEYAAAHESWLLFPSTDFVWDGRSTDRYSENDSPMPGTYYGRTKVAGEQAVLERDAGLVVRYSLLVGLPVCPRETTWTKFVDALTAGSPLQGCADEFRSPLSIADAAAITVALGRAGKRGVLHVAGPETLSSREIIERLASALGVTPNLTSISRLDLPGGADRPRNVAMDASTVNALFADLVPDPLSVRALTNLIATRTTSAH